jgi:hypothetical protein
VPYRINAGVHTVQPSVANARQDRVAREAAGVELRQRDDTVLLGGKHPHANIRGCVESVGSPLTDSTHPLVRHPPIVREEVSRRQRPTVAHDTHSSGRALQRSRIVLSDLPITARPPFAYVAIETSGGPHVTPVLYGLTSDRLWLVVQRSTLKARVLAVRPRVGVLLDAGDTGIAIRGEARVIDPLRPARLVARAPELARAPCAIPSFLGRNAAELAAFPRDLGLRPPDVVFAAIRPYEMTSVKRPAPAPRAAATAEPLLADVPADLLALAQRPGPVVLALETEQGPLALPASWDPQTSHAQVDPSSVPEHAATRACVCFDTTRGRGPAAKAGLLLRGDGHASGRGRIAVDPTRVTWWQGLAVATAPVAAAAAAAA